MSRHGEIELPFGEKVHTFRLGIREWEKVQERCDAGPPELLMRLFPLVNAMRQAKAAKKPASFLHLMFSNALGTWRTQDIVEPLLHGLVGGGMTSTEAGVLVRQVLEEGPMWEQAPVAYLVIEASFTPAAEDQKPGERKAGAKKTPKRSRAANSASATSTGLQA